MSSYKKCSSENGAKWKILSKGFDNKYNMATRGIGHYKGDLYIGTQSFCRKEKIERDRLLHLLFSGNILPHGYASKSRGCEMWKYNNKTSELTQMIGDKPGADMSAGFGSKTNFSAAFIKEFKGDLYIGTANSPNHGCEIWKYDGKKWEQVVNAGFDDTNNYGAWTVEEFKDYLYVGTTNWNRSKSGFAQIWRTVNGSDWEKVVDRGFRDFCKTQKSHNRYVWAMAVYKDCLYAGTYNHPAFLGNRGCQLFKTYDGIKWEKMDLPGGDGFGKPANYGIRKMKVYNNELIMGTAVMNPFHGFQIWKYNGSKWYFVGWDKNYEFKGDSKTAKKDPFLSRHEKYAWSMLITSDNKFIVGCSNGSEGCKMFQYNGSQWEQLVGEQGEISSGFGKKSNVGIRSMIEYPQGSKNIIVGTSTTFIFPKFCEIWQRNI